MTIGHLVSLVSHSLPQVFLLCKLRPSPFSTQSQFVTAGQVYFFFTLFSVSHGAWRSSGGAAAELALSNGRATSMGAQPPTASPPPPTESRLRAAQI